MNKNKIQAIFKRNIGGWLLILPTGLIFMIFVWRPILRADMPDGEFVPISDTPITPDEWEALDGTRYVV